MHDPAALRLESVTVDFGGLRALNDVSIEINPGEVVGIIGPNGAGKTTLFNVLSGLVTPTSGSLYIGGVKRKWPKVHELNGLGLSRTLQGVGLFSELSVAKNLLVGATNSKKPNFLKALLGLYGGSERKLDSGVQRILEEL